MSHNYQDRDYWYWLLATIFWLAFIWLAAEAWLEVIR